MWPSQRSQTQLKRGIHSPPLCANNQFYRQLDPRYPRHRIWRIGRFLLSRFVLDALGLLGLLFFAAENIITSFASEGPQLLNSKQLTHLYMWQLAMHYPFAVVAFLTVFLLLIPVGLWMKADEHKEKKALERQMEGYHLAQGYRAYLEHIVTKTGALPRLLQPDYHTTRGAATNCGVDHESVIAHTSYARLGL